LKRAKKRKEGRKEGRKETNTDVGGKNGEEMRKP